MSKTSLAVAIEALSWMAYAGLGERSALFRAADQLDATADELRQAHHLIMETTRFQNRVDYFLSLVSDSKLDRIPHGVSAFLRILTFMRYVERRDERHIRSAISAARQILGWKTLRPYEEIMGRLLAGASQDFQTQDEYENASLQTCHTKWYVERVLLLFGRDFGLQILNRDLKPLPVYMRLNPLQPSSLQAQDSRGSELDGLKGVWRLRDSRSLGRQQLELVSSGRVVIQDLSAIVSGLVASPQPGDRVLDICAAPGNKTTHLAALMSNDGEIFSVDSSTQRMAHWKREVDRAGCSIAYGIIADATRLGLNIETEVVLVDPPCSNTGVFAKNPSMKWRLSPVRLQTLIEKQSAILASASKHVRVGGSLVYSTCSILPEENEDVIASFLQRNPDFNLERHSPFLGSPGLKGLDRCQRFFPNLHECNGSFIAKLQRT